MLKKADRIKTDQSGYTNNIICLLISKLKPKKANKRLKEMCNFGDYTDYYQD